MLDYCIQFRIFRVHLLPLLAPVRAHTCARLNTTITLLHPVLVAIGRSVSWACARSHFQFHFSLG
jgi:hypothetical protein